MGAYQRAKKCKQGKQPCQGRCAAPKPGARNNLPGPKEDSSDLAAYSYIYEVGQQQSATVLPACPYKILFIFSSNGSRSRYSGLVVLDKLFNILQLKEYFLDVFLGSIFFLADQVTYQFFKYYSFIYNLFKLVAFVDIYIVINIY